MELHPLLLSVSLSLYTPLYFNIISPPFTKDPSAFFSAQNCTGFVISVHNCCYFIQFFSIHICIWTLTQHCDITISFLDSLFLSVTGLEKCQWGWGILRECQGDMSYGWLVAIVWWTFGLVADWLCVLYSHWPWHTWDLVLHQYRLQWAQRKNTESYCFQPWLPGWK